MSNEELYSGNPKSSNVSTYLYLCRRNVTEGCGKAYKRCALHYNKKAPEMKGRFISAVTVDMGRDNSSLDGQEILDNLVNLREEENRPSVVVVNPDEEASYPRVIWSGSVFFYKSGACNSWTNKSVVKFYPAYNKDTYLEQRGESRDYTSGIRDQFVSKNGSWWLCDEEKIYFHSSNGDSMIQASDLDGWGGIEAIRERGIECWKLRSPLSMKEFLTDIGQSQGHVGYIRNPGKRFAPNCYIFSNENGRGFCYSILKKFGAKSKEM